MAKFEYIQLEVVRDTSNGLSVIMTDRKGTDRFATTLPNLIPFLNELGADGWEVVAAVPSGGRVRGKTAASKLYGSLEAETLLEERVYLLKRLVP